MKLELMSVSWENLFDNIRGSNIVSKGNFWSAVQYLEQQYQEQCNKKQISITMSGVNLMTELGGSFVVSIAEAWRYADAENKRVLEQNFKYFEEYELLAERRKQ